MGAILSPSKPSPPPPPPPAPAVEDPAVQDARRRELAQQMATKGRRSTLLTGTEGVTGDAPVARKTLLGQ